VSVTSSRKKSKKEIQRARKGMRDFIVFTVIYAIFLMWISGMSQFYFPEVVSPGGGQYFDIYIGIFIIGSALYIMIAAYILKKK